MKGNSLSAVDFNCSVSQGSGQLLQESEFPIPIEKWGLLNSGCAFGFFSDSVP